MLQYPGSRLHAPRPLLLTALITALATGCSDAPVAPPPASAPETAALAPERDFEPVVLTGDSVPSLVGVPPAQLVAFRITAGASTEIPAQIDERAVIALGSAYRGIDATRCTPPTWCQNLVGAVVQLYYSDPGTFVGADPDPAFDSDDEMVFMARDAGTEEAVNTAAPSGVQPGTGVKVTISEPKGGRSGYVYLYQQNGSLSQGAGQSYVNYNFAIASGGNYLTSYDRAGTSPDDNRSNQNPGGVVVGGGPDNVRAGPLDWESLQGARGTMVTAYTLASNVPALSRISDYDDAVTSGSRSRPARRFTP